MRVLHVCDFFLRYTVALANAMADNGEDVLLFSRDHGLEFGGDPRAMRRYVGGRAHVRLEHATLPGRIREPAGLRATARLRRRRRKFSPQVMHLQESIGTDPRLWVAAGMPNNRFALTVHDPAPHLGEEWPLGRRLGFQALVRRAGVIFVHSDVLKETLAAQSRTSAPIVVVPHGVDAPQVAAVPSQVNFLFFGRIESYKGVDLLLDAMPMVWESLPEATVTIAGSGVVDQHPQLTDDRVILRNEHVPDDHMPALFAAATCCVLPYREASQSGVGSNAKSYGRAIVATDVGGLPELVGADAGKIVPANDAAALARALIEVAATPGLASAMGNAGASTIAASGWDKVAEITVDSYAQHLRQ